MKCVSRSYWLLSRILLTIASLTATPEAQGVSADVYANPTRWVDEGGEQYKLEKLRGKKTVFALFYTSCKTICPMTVKSLKAIEAGLGGAAKDVQFVLVTIDPADGPGNTSTGASGSDRVRDFIRTQKISPGWKILTSDTGSTRGLAGALGVGFEEKPVNGNFHNMHSLSMVIVKSDGSISGQLPVASADASEFKRLLAK